MKKWKKSPSVVEISIEIYIMFRTFGNHNHVCQTGTWQSSSSEELIEQNPSNIDFAIARTTTELKGSTIFSTFRPGAVEH